MTGTLLVVNCGSSSVKLAVYSGKATELLASALAENLHSPQARLRITYPERSEEPLPAQGDHEQAIEHCLQCFKRANWLGRAPLGIGHRVVHGGERFTASAVIDKPVTQAIEACAALAPLHNPANLKGIQLLGERFPDVPQVAVFDTAFHQTLPEHAFLYAIPYSLYKEHGVRRYGFHGTSHRYILQQLAQDLGKAESETSLISAHLGNGCSITAISNGRSVDTSMGLTPLEGLVMGTRSGDVDPGLFDFLASKGIDAAETHRILNRESGLLGLSENTNDMRSIESAAQQGSISAQRALDVFCFRLARYVGAMMASLTRLDALVFTGGIGENSAGVRSRTLSHLANLGFAMDDDANACHGDTNHGELQVPGSYRIKVIKTNEELMIAADTRRLTQSLKNASERNQGS